MKIIHIGPSNKCLVGLDGASTNAGQNLYVRSQPVVLAGGYGTYSHYKVKLEVIEVNNQYALCKVIRKSEDKVQNSDISTVELNDPVVDNANLFSNQ